MGKSNSGCRRAGSATRSVYTGGAPRQLQKPIYGSTPKERLGNNPSQHLGQKISGSNPSTHVVGAPRDK